MSRYLQKLAKTHFILDYSKFMENYIKSACYDLSDLINSNNYFASLTTFNENQYHIFKNLDTDLYRNEIIPVLSNLNHPEKNSILYRVLYKAINEKHGNIIILTAGIDNYSDPYYQEYLPKLIRDKQVQSLNILNYGKNSLYLENLAKLTYGNYIKMSKKN